MKIEKESRERKGEILETIYHESNNSISGEAKNRTRQKDFNRRKF